MKENNQTSSPDPKSEKKAQSPSKLDKQEAELSDYHSKLGPIPADNFENDPGPYKPPVLSEQEAGRFNQGTEEQKARIRKAMTQRQQMQKEQTP